MRGVGLIAALLVAMPLQAQSNPVAIESAVFVERNDGASRVVEGTGQFRKGERVVTIVRWQAPRGSFMVTSPVPACLQFEDSSAEGIEVSTDGGRNWVAIRLVQPEAVTHLRWRVGNGAGRLTYSAIVR